MHDSVYLDKEVLRVISDRKISVRLLELDETLFPPINSIIELKNISSKFQTEN